MTCPRSRGSEEQGEASISGTFQSPVPPPQTCVELRGARAPPVCRLLYPLPASFHAQATAAVSSCPGIWAGQGCTPAPTPLTQVRALSPRELMELRKQTHRTSEPGRPQNASSPSLCCERWEHGGPERDKTGPRSLVEVVAELGQRPQASRFPSLSLFRPECHGNSKPRRVRWSEIVRQTHQARGLRRMTRTMGRRRRRSMDGCLGNRQPDVSGGWEGSGRP